MNSMVFYIGFLIVFSGLYILGDLLRIPLLKYVFKPLATILIIFFALLQPMETSETYKFLIITALVFSLVGDVFLLLPSDKFVHGLVSFLIAHLFFIAAFALGFGPYLEISYLIPSAIYAVVFLWVLLSKTGNLKIPVLVYSLVLMVFLWQASGRFYYLADSSSSLILTGAVLFIVSDTVLAYDRFVRSYKFSSALIHSTYWAALFFLVLSI